MKMVEQESTFLKPMYSVVFWIWRKFAIGWIGWMFQTSSFIKLLSWICMTRILGQLNALSRNGCVLRGAMVTTSRPSVSGWLNFMHIWKMYCYFSTKLRVIFKLDFGFLNWLRVAAYCRRAKVEWKEPSQAKSKTRKCEPYLRNTRVSTTQY